MYRFKVFHNGEPAKAIDLDGACLVGTDRVPLRAELKFHNGEILCDVRSRGAAALSIMWPVDGVGRIMLETTRLVERRQPYNLNVELARGQLMRISQKREDWGLYDFESGEGLYREVDAARKTLVEALTASDGLQAARHGDTAIAASIKIGERMGLFHADLFLTRRRTSNQLDARPLGCQLDPMESTEDHVQRLSEGFDFAAVPLNWGMMEPKEGLHLPQQMDQCIQMLRHRRIPIRGNTLLSFEPSHVPQWLGALAKDYKQVRECVAKHVQYVLDNFGTRIATWEAVAGIHAHNIFNFSFEQLMDLTRLTVSTVKQMFPKSPVMIGLVLPWGEYYARNPRTIPPLLYAEMAVQSGIQFDAFGVDMHFGYGQPSAYVRDLMQISAMLDRLGTLGKTIHVTAAGVPSAGGSAVDGFWRGRWTEEVQAKWAQEFYQIALSKPLVETVTWHRLVDAGWSAGLLDSDLQIKPVYEQLMAFRRERLLGGV